MSCMKSRNGTSISRGWTPAFALGHAHISEPPSLRQEAEFVDADFESYRAGRSRGGMTPDRSRIRPKSRPARRCHPCSRGLNAGAPPRLGKGHPSTAACLSDPHLTELAPLSPRGTGGCLPAPWFEQG